MFYRICHIIIITLINETQASLVPTVEVVRLRFFLDLLIQAGRPVMLIGTAGTGKSVIIQQMFQSLPELFIIKNIPFNFYTTSKMLQDVLDKSLEKKAGIKYGPPGQHRLIYFIDDLNMPEVSEDHEMLCQLFFYDFRCHLT